MSERTAAQSTKRTRPSLAAARNRSSNGSLKGSGSFTGGSKRGIDSSRGGSFSGRNSSQRQSAKDPRYSQRRTCAKSTGSSRPQKLLKESSLASISGHSNSSTEMQSVTQTSGNISNSSSESSLADFKTLQHSAAAKDFRESFSARTAPTTKGDSNTSFDLSEEPAAKEHDMTTIHSVGGGSRSHFSSGPIHSTVSDDLAKEHCGNNQASQESDNEDGASKNTEKTGVWRSVHNFRERCGSFINNERVQLVIIIMIVINAFMMGLGTFDFVQDNPGVDKAFEATDMIFLLIFTIELWLQLIYHDVRLFLDGWLVFDFVIIVLSWSMSSMQVIRAFRIFRAFRLVTRLDVLRNLVLALFEVAPSMSAIIALLLLILYIFAVMCTVLFGDLYEMGVLDEDYFGTLDQTLFTLFQMMTLEWADIVRSVMTEYYWAWGIFGPFLIMTSFILYSLMIAVVCDAVAVTEHSEEEVEEFHKDGELQEQVERLETRLQEMANHQQVLLQALQQALKQMDAKQEEHALHQHELKEAIAIHKDPTYKAELWQWAGEVKRPTMMADTLMMREEAHHDTPENVHQLLHPDLCDSSDEE